MCEGIWRGCCNGAQQGGALAPHTKGCWKHDTLINPFPFLTPAMGWSVKGNSAINLFFSFLFCAIESCVALWIVSSGRARA